MQDYDAINIRSFAELVLREGDLPAGGKLPDPERALLGAKIHRRIQQQRKTEKPAYTAEKSVSFTVSDPDGELEVCLEGRTDGYYRENGTLFVEEIKTVDELPTAAGGVPVHFAQVALYALALYREGCADGTPDGIVRIRLHYVRIPDEAERFCETEWTPGDLQNYCNGLFHTYFSWLIPQQHRFSHFCAEIGTLQFPFDSFRDGQRSVSVSVYKTLNRGDASVLLLQAPTGIGKTVGVLFPALKALLSLPERPHPKIFYLTARGEGARSAEQTARTLGKRIPSLITVSLTAKEKICPFPADKRVCDPVVCPYARGHYDRVPDALRAAIARRPACLTRTEISKLAEQFTVCPFELSLDLALFSDLIIGDYNYLFDADAYLRRFFESGVMPFYFLIDEAHNLPDRVREMNTVRISGGTLKKIEKQYPKTPVCRAAARLRRLMGKDGAVIGTEKSAEIAFSAEFLRSLSRFSEHCRKFFADKAGSTADTELFSCWMDVRSMLRISESADERHFRNYAEKTGKRQFDFTLLCTDPSEIIAERCRSSKGTVLFSGTLLPKRFFARELGFPEAPYLAVPSPFSPQNRLVLCGTSVSTRYTERSRYYRAVAEFIEGLAGTAEKANYIVYFNSYAYLDAILALLPADFCRLHVTVQPRGNGPEERGKFLEGFSENPERLQIGFCVLGGSFSEGVDLPGDRLTGVVVVGVGLPMVCTARELIRKTAEEQETGSGFENAYLYPGLNKVIQAGGRLIRHERDRGFLVLLDARYTQKNYREGLPAEWDPVFCRSLSEILKKIKFFNIKI